MLFSEIEDDVIVRFCEVLQEETGACIFSPHILALLMDSQHPKDAVQDFAQGITPSSGVHLNKRVHAIGHPPAHWIAIEISHDTEKIHAPDPFWQHRAQTRTKWCLVWHIGYSKFHWVGYQHTQFNTTKRTICCYNPTA